MGSQTQFELDKLEPKQILSKQECRYQIASVLINPDNRGLYQIWQRVWFVEKHNLIPLIQSVMFYTRDLDITFVERIYRVYQDNYDIPVCNNCRKNPVGFDKFTVGFRKFCSFRCNAVYNKPISRLTEESKLRRSRKLSQARSGKRLSEEWKRNLKLAANDPLTKKKKQDTCETRYGTKNPGVLGAYSSRSAQEFIKNYLVKNDIDPSLCMFKDSQGSQEFWQMVLDPDIGKHRYMSYDLVIFDSVESKNARDTTGITTVLEYNGPWHYASDDVLGHGDEPATPYKSNKLTKKQVHDLDSLKIRHILRKGARQVLVFWEKKISFTRITLDDGGKLVENHVDRDVLPNDRL